MTTLAANLQDRLSPSVPTRAPGGAPGMSGAELWGMFRRRLVHFMVMFVLFSGVAIGGFVIWWVNFPGYSSESLVECISNIPETELTIEQQRLRQDEHERFVRTQALLVKSPGILGEVLKITAVRETDWYKDVTRRGKAHLLELTEQLIAAPIRGTNFLRVAMECRNNGDAAVIVNEVVGLWFQTVKKRTAEEFASDALAAMTKEIDDLDRQLTLDRERLKSIAERLPPGAIQNPANNITAQEVRQYGEQVAVLELEKAQLEQYRTLYNNPDAIAVTAEDRATVEQDLLVAELSRSLFLLQQQRAAEEQTYGPGHSARRQLDGQIAALETKLDQTRLEKLRERKADIREAANTAYENTRYALFLAQEKLTKAEQALQDQDRLLFDYFELNSKVETDTEARVKLNDYVKSLSRIKTQRTAINVNISQTAIPALERSSPSKLMVPAGVMLALVAAASLAVGLEALDKSVRTSQDVIRHMEAPMLGAIPDSDDEEVSIEVVETALRDAPRSMLAEGFRIIRTNLRFSAPADRLRSVLVTSPGPEDGKSTVACNLALALAQSSRRVLLIDANFRRSRLQNVFGVSPAKGLSHFLVAEGALNEVLVPTGVANLDMIASGQCPPNPAELLGGESWRVLLREVRGTYDHVIVDGPPVLLANDAVVLSTSVDGVILVLRAHQSTKGMARRACGVLADVRAHLFGAILNAAQVTRGGYYREQLRAYYEYQSEADSAAKV